MREAESCNLLSLSRKERREEFILSLLVSLATEKKSRKDLFCRRCLPLVVSLLLVEETLYSRDRK